MRFLSQLTRYCDLFLCLVLARLVGPSSCPACALFVVKGQKKNSDDGLNEVSEFVIHLVEVVDLGAELLLEGDQVVPAGPAPGARFVQLLLQLSSLPAQPALLILHRLRDDASND